MPAVLPAEIQDFVTRQMSSGRFGSEDELLVLALRTLQELTIRHQDLQADILASLAQADRGEGGPLNVDEVIAGVDREMSFEKGRR